MISYQPRSKLAALKIAHRLKAAGFDVWIDVENKCTYMTVVLYKILISIANYKLRFQIVFQILFSITLEKVHKM